MAADLHERLSDLAAHTQPGPPPTDLWVRGVRRRRVVAAGGVAVALALAGLIGIGGWTWHQSRPVEPADTHGSPHLPDRFFEPSPWLAFDAPPGQLVAVGTAERKTLFHTTTAVYGVTASSGTYGFLELPGAVTDDPFIDPVSLSPDGRHLAVWVTGPVSRKPHGPTVIAGLDVHDLVTGAVDRWRPHTAHGLSPDRMSWAGDDTLLFITGRWANGDSVGGTAYRNNAYRWDLGSGVPRALAKALGSATFDWFDTTTGRQVVTGDGRRVWIVDLEAPLPPVSVTGMRSRHEPLWVNPSGTRLVGLLGENDTGKLVTGRVPARGGDVLDRAVLTAAGGRHIYVLDGWLDDRHLLAEVRMPGDEARSELDSIDVRSGRAESLIAPYLVSDVATGPLSAPVVHASPPPRPLNQRVVAGLAGCGFLCAGLLLWWRFRGRRA